MYTYFVKQRIDFLVSLKKIKEWKLEDYISWDNARLKLYPAFRYCCQWFIFVKQILSKAVWICYEYRSCSNQRCPFIVFYGGKVLFYISYTICIYARCCLQFLKQPLISKSLFFKESTCNLLRSYHNSVFPCEPLTLHCMSSF